MARKKKKRKKKINPFPLVTGVARFFGYWSFRSLPIFVFLAASYFSVLGMQRYLYADPNLLVSSIRLITDGEYSREKVLSKVSIGEDTSIFNVNTKQIAHALLADPRIKKAIVKKEFPNTLLIDLKIRKNFAFLNMPPSHTYYLLDQEGYVISRHKQAPPEDNLRIIDQSISSKRLEPGDIYFTENIENVFYIAQSIQERGIFPKSYLKELRIDRLNNLSLVLKEGVEIKLGNAQLDENLKKIPQALKILQKESIPIALVRYIDLRFEDIIIKKR